MLMLRLLLPMCGMQHFPGFSEPCDTVVMNPPFGAQKAHADRPFIDLALSIAPVAYSIFNAGSAQFIETYTAERAEDR